MHAEKKAESAPFALIVLMAAACGFAVANIYYNQSMLPLFAATFQRSTSEAGQVATITQLGYAAGLLLFVPLGDRMARKPLLLGLLAANTLTLVGLALAPSFHALLVGSAVLGLTSVSAQIIIPAASLLAAPEQRGKVMGMLISGLSTGILLARTLSGFVGSHAGWRSMFAIAAGLDIALIALIALRLPAAAPATDLPYGKLLKSLWNLFREEPVLRAAAGGGALTFATFSCFWGALAFLLAQPPYRLGSDAAGMFGLVALIGIALSTAIGGLTDRLGTRHVLMIGALLLALASAGLWFGANSLLLLVGAAVLIDLGNRASLIAGQTRIYALSTEARSRLNTVFMGCYFSGGAAGSAVGAIAADHAGWHGLALVGLLLSLAALVIHGFSKNAPR